MLFFHSEDTFAFWRGLKEAGLLEEVIQEFQAELLETMKGLQQRILDPPLQLSGKKQPVHQFSWQIDDLGFGFLKFLLMGSGHLHCYHVF